MSDSSVAVAIYDIDSEAYASVQELQKSNFNIKHLSIVGRGYYREDQVIGFSDIDGRMKVWGAQGAFWGRVHGLLSGAAFFLVPGVGPVMVFGPLVSSIVRELETAAAGGDLSALGAGLYSVGVPADSAGEYEAVIKAAKFVLVAEGTVDEVARAKSVLDTTGARKVAAHAPPRSVASVETWFEAKRAEPVGA
jgi:hypothetical protein